MIYEYLLFNLFILAGPVVFSFDEKVRFVSYWRQALISIILVAIPFILWDSLVVHKHWWFNPQHTLSFRVLGLPLGEILFFISVPFACLFVWQILVTFHEKEMIRFKGIIYAIAFLLAVAAVYFLIHHKIYTGLVCGVLVFTVIIDTFFRQYILFQRRSGWFLLLVTGFIFVFNGYLTARPLVLYGERFMSGLRIWTIPIEDFGYGYSLVLLSVILYEYIKERQNV